MNGALISARDAAEQFPGTFGQIYMNTAARGLLPTRTRDAVTALLSDQANGVVDKDAWFAMAERTRGLFASLIGAVADEITFTKNISEGLNIVATGIGWRPGDNVVLCADIEHPNNIFPWYHLARERGIEVREIESHDGALSVADMIAAIDGRTRLMTVPTVSFSPGLRTHLQPLGRACRERGVFLLGDGAQSVGILDTNVETLGLDGLAVSTQKGLLGLYGLGFLYCRKAWAERMTPAYLARFGVDLGGAHEAARGSADFRFMPGARRFDLGNYNFPAIAAAEQSIGLLLGIGTDRIEAHVVGLAHRLADGLLDLDVQIAGGRPGPHLGSIVCAGHFGQGGHDTTDDREMASLYAALAEAGVRLSIRQGMLRFSLHLYNTPDDVARVIALAQSWRARLSRPAYA